MKYDEHRSWRLDAAPHRPRQIWKSWIQGSWPGWVQYLLQVMNS